MFIIDTNSLINLVRYYLPFDSDGSLFNFIQKKIELKEIIIIDKVYSQCTGYSSGLVVKAMPFLKNKKLHTSTKECLPDNEIFEHLYDDFTNLVIKKDLDEIQIENQTNAYLEDADFKLILYSRKNQSLFSKLEIVTEETEEFTDKKLFKKIPTICGILELTVITLPEMLKKFEGVCWDFKRQT